MNNPYPQYLNTQKDAQKVGFNPEFSQNAYNLSLINKVLLLINGISFVDGAIAALLGSPIGFAVGFIIFNAGVASFLFKIGDEWSKILELNGLLASVDKRELAAIIGESTKLAKQISAYKKFSDMPPELQSQVKDCIKKNYIAKNEMKKALLKAQQVNSKRQRFS